MCVRKQSATTVSGSAWQTASRLPALEHAASGLARRAARVLSQWLPLQWSVPPAGLCQPQAGPASAPASPRLASTPAPASLDTGGRPASRPPVLPLSEFAPPLLPGESPPPVDGPGGAPSSSLARFGKSLVGPPKHPHTTASARQASGPGSRKLRPEAGITLSFAGSAAGHKAARPRSSLFSPARHGGRDWGPARCSRR